MPTQIPIPAQDRMVRLRDWKRYPKPQEKDPLEGLPSDAWNKYFSAHAQVLAQTPTRETVVSLAVQQASLVALPFALGATPAGLYEVRYYATVTRGASTSSSLTVTIAWTDDGQSKSVTSSAMTGNNTASVLVGSVALMRIDQASPITYATAYASVGATPMQYSLAMVVTRIR